MVQGRGFERFPDAETVALRALLVLPRETLERHASRVLERSLAVAVRTSEDQTSALGRALRERREAFGGEAPREFLRAAPLPEERDSLERAINVIAAVNPAIAAQRITSALRSARIEYVSTKDEEEARTAVMARLRLLFDILDLLAHDNPGETRSAVRDLPRRATPRMFADRLLQSLEFVSALNLAMPAPFLRAAALSSSDGAKRALRHGLGRAGIGPEELQAILVGLARWGFDDEAMRADARTLISRRSNVLPVIDQLAYVGRQGSPAIAESLSGGQNLVKEILNKAGSELHQDSERTERLLQAAAAWNSGARKVRKSAGAGYSTLLDSVKTEKELSIVLSGALAFFQEPDRVENVRKLRSSLRRVLERLPAIESSNTRDLLEQAATQLRIEQPSEHWFTDLIREN